ncbi:hypothetical protein D3C76_25300 [compost metagenome]
MNFIKQFRARHAERRKVYDNIVKNRQAIRDLIGDQEGHHKGYNRHSEEVRALYRELNDYIRRFADIIGSVTWLDTIFHNTEMWKQVEDVKNPWNDVKHLMFSPEEITLYQESQHVS